MMMRMKSMRVSPEGVTSQTSHTPQRFHPQKNAPGRMKQARGDAQERQTVRRILGFANPLCRHFPARLLAGVQAGKGAGQA